MFTSLSALPMDGPVGIALASMLVAFTMSVFGLLRNASPVKSRKREHNHD